MGRCRAVLAAEGELYGCALDEGHPVSPLPQDPTPEDLEALEYHQGFTLEGQRARWLDVSPGAFTPGVPAVPATEASAPRAKPRPRPKVRRAPLLPG